MPDPSIRPAVVTRPIDVPIELLPTVESLIAAFKAGRAPSAISGDVGLEYARHAAPRRPWVDVPLLAAMATVAGALLTLMMTVVPRFELIFKDFGTELPQATKWLLRFSRFVANDFGWIPIGLVAVAIPVLWARLRPWPPASGRYPGLGSVLLAVLMVGAIGMITYTILMLPMIRLIQTVSGGSSSKGF